MSALFTGPGVSRSFAIDDETLWRRSQRAGREIREEVVRHSLLLGPGSYTLSVEISGRSAERLSSGAWQYGYAVIEFSAVPEPRTLALVGMGLAVIARRRPHL